MCGIGGILRRDGEAIPEGWLDIIDARVAYRGPDGEGRFRDRVEWQSEDGPQRIDVALVHRRLSIIDHEDGAQPMVSERGRDGSEGLVAVVFNGCIYNHRELRAELTAAGRAFVTDHSDTEVLIHGWREWGAELEDRLEGMYAIAIWDRDARSLALMRDWFGEKPLYVRWTGTHEPSTLVFASDARAVASIEGPTTPEDTDALGCWTSTYLQLGYNWRFHTCYDGLAGGVNAVQPSIVTDHKMIFPRKQRETLAPVDFELLIDAAVQSRLEADVPLGCFLSGGVDSSLIAHLAHQHKPDLRTFTVRMPDERYDESTCAEAVAEHIGTDHITLDAPASPAEDLVHLIRTLGQPFGDSSILPTYWVSRAAREHMKVALSGDGGDELFLGYDRYMAARRLVRHRRLLRWLPSRKLLARHPKSKLQRIGRAADMARDLNALGVLAMESIFTQRQIAALLGQSPPCRADYPWGFDPMQSLRRVDTQSYLPGDLLTKLDTASMTVALEVRAPFLDRDLVRAAFEAPTWQLMAGGRRKGLLRGIARKYLPDPFVDRPKMGFAIPIGEWFRNDFGGMKTLLHDHLESADPFGLVPIDRAAAMHFVSEHESGAVDHSQRLFVLLTLAIWAQSL